MAANPATSQAGLQKIEVHQREDKTWGWRLIVNGDIVATDGGQGYDDKYVAERMGTRVVNGHYYRAATNVELVK